MKQNWWTIPQFGLLTRDVHLVFFFTPNTFYSLFLDVHSAKKKIEKKYFKKKKWNENEFVVVNNQKEDQWPEIEK